MGFTSDACWFLLIKTLLIKNNKKREAALKNEADGEEKRVFFTWPYTVVGSYYLTVNCLSENKGKRNLDYFSLSIG